MRRIGILGGTFDPVHNGHLLLGEQAYREYGLDEIWFMPSHVPPHKKDHLITDGAAYGGDISNFVTPYVADEVHKRLRERQGSQV